MSAEDEVRQDWIWERLYRRIKRVLQRFGREDAFGEADYLIVSDNYGWTRHTIEIHKLHMLRPEIAAMLRALLRDHPNWEIVVAVDIPGTEDAWPPMGITIRKQEIIDGLLRQYLPADVRNFHYEDSRPGTGYD